MKEYQILVDSLKSSGFTVPCATDMASYLISCLSRPDPAGNIAGIKKDIDDVVKALETLKNSI